jgi:hypothetical protein
MSDAAVLILLPLPRTRLPLLQHSQVLHLRPLLTGRLVAFLFMPQPPTIICRPRKQNRVHCCICRRRRRPRSLNDTLHLLIAYSRRRPRLLLLPLRPAAAICCSRRLL